MALQHLPGTGGHPPAEGFHPGGRPTRATCRASSWPSLATLCLGAVLGPEAPLIAIGSGLGVLAVHLVRKDAPQQAVGGRRHAGSFAAIATLLGSPITGAFLSWRPPVWAAPCWAWSWCRACSAAGIGALIFIGLDRWTGLGTFSLALPDLPVPATTPTVAELLWAIVIGSSRPCWSRALRRGALVLQARRTAAAAGADAVFGLLVAASAVVFEVVTDKASSFVLFSGQDALPTLVHHASSWSTGALIALLLCKGVAYSLSLSCLRGGPVFPGMFLGAALGIVVAQLPGLSMIAGVAAGIGAMTVAMLGSPRVGAAAVAAAAERRGDPDAAGHRRGGHLLRRLGPAEPHP